MKNIIILGASGFIGRQFIKSYREKYRITAIDKKIDQSNTNKELVNWIEGDITNLDFLAKKSIGKDVLINLVYIRDNLDLNYKIIKNILSACLLAGINKIIHISTVSVYNPFIEGKLTENCEYSRVKDHYSRIKIQQEKKLFNFVKRNNGFKAIILQPTIIFGNGGVWDNHAKKEIKKSILFLPGGGDRICNVVSINDVANAISLSIDKDTNSNYECFLISGNENITWKKFYQIHAENAGFDNLKVENLKSRNKYHDRTAINLMYYLVFSRFGFNLLRLFGRFTKYIAAEKSKFDDKFQEAFTPVGMNRLVHNCKFKVSTDKIHQHLGYSPEYKMRDHL